MSRTSAATTVRAAEVAEGAAARAGVTVREVHDLEEESAISDLLDRVWGAEARPVMPANLLHAISHAGNYLAAARLDGRIIGAAFGFLGWDDLGVFLHSHMTGVDPDVQRAGVGFALKLHQRSWALAHGLNKVVWTFDPLVRRNSYFNLMKLGAEIVDYHVNFYGDMPDGINTGDESDRVLVAWDVASERVSAACDGTLREPNLDELRAGGAVVVLDYDDDLRPIVGTMSGRRLLCHIPEDIVALRTRDQNAARDWRYALRETFARALQDNHRVRAITRSGWYYLEQGGAA